MHEYEADSSWRPGAGKGTQAEILSERLNIPTISTGNIIREALKNGN